MKASVTCTQFDMISFGVIHKNGLFNRCNRSFPETAFYDQTAELAMTRTIRARSCCMSQDCRCMSQDCEYGSFSMGFRSASVLRCVAVATPYSVFKNTRERVNPFVYTRRHIKLQCCACCGLCLVVLQDLSEVRCFVASLFSSPFIISSPQLRASSLSNHYLFASEHSQRGVSDGIALCQSRMDDTVSTFAFSFVSADILCSCIFSCTL